MKIALLGFGKMGKMISEIALERNHSIVLVISDENLTDLTVSNLKKADIAIDFSVPAVATDHIYMCFEAGIPIVVGTTGWYGKLQQIKNDCIHSNNSLLYATNFSVGVNLFFEINKQVAKIMHQYGTDYQIHLDEIHHTQKLDSPSGTAMTIAEGVLDEFTDKNEWVNLMQDELETKKNEVKEEQLLIVSHRIENVPGTHSVTYTSDIDSIEIKHTAHNRKGFALGAVIAAEWLVDKTGFFTMSDVFAFDRK